MKRIHDNAGILIPVAMMIGLVLGAWAGELLAYGSTYYLCARDHRATFDSRIMLHPLEIECRAKTIPKGP